MFFTVLQLLLFVIVDNKKTENNSRNMVKLSLGGAEVKFRSATQLIRYDFLNSFYHLLQKQEENSENTSISEVLGIAYMCIGGQASYIEKVKSQLWEICSCKMQLANT